jgi:hypothetical protein
MWKKRNSVRKKGSDRFAALENIEYNVDINRDWESIRENIKKTPEHDSDHSSLTSANVIEFQTHAACMPLYGITQMQEQFYPGLLPFYYNMIQNRS